MRDVWRVSLGLVAAGAGAAGVGTPLAAAAPPVSEVLVATSGDGAPPSGARPVARIGGVGFFNVTVPRGTTAERFAARLSRRSGVAAVQPNTPVRRASIAGTCVDTPAAPTTQTAVAANARSRTPPGTTGPVAVLDTGVDPTVPELAGRVLATSNAITGTPPASPDDDGHGTQVAAAAAGKPGLVAGISPTSPIMPIRVATASVLATPATIVKGLEIAANRKARVAVLPSSQLLSEVFANSVSTVGIAIDAAFSDGVVTVVPAGNEGQNEQTFPGTLAHVLTVGSAASAAGRDEFSNYGPWLDLLAPGADLVLPAPPSLCLSGYARASGTSFAAGAVAGATALIAAARPRLTTAGLYDVVRRLASADVTPSGFDANSGFGMLDVGKGLSATAAPADPHEVDDNVYWLKRRSSAFPTYMRRTRTATVRGSVGPGKDPQDAVKVHLQRGDVLRVRVTNPNTAAVLYASIWSRGTGDFDMRLPAPDSELRAAGFTQNPSVSYRATRTGTYYVAVFAPVWTIPGEQGTRGKDLAPLSPPRTAYRLSMTRRR